MKETEQDFPAAVERIVTVVMFENWLRFYFIREDAQQGTLLLDIPQQSLAKISELYPELLPLAQDVVGKTVDFDTSRNAVCTYVMRELDGKALARGVAGKVFDSGLFQIQLQLFNTWVQAHEDQLDQAFMEFGMWRSLFAAWCDTDEVREWADTLRTSQGQMSPARDNVQQ